MTNLTETNKMNQKFAKFQLSTEEQAKIKGGGLFNIGFTCEEKRGYRNGEEYTYEAMYFNVGDFKVRVR